MALQNDTSRIQYNGNNSTTSSYAIPFVFFEDSHVRCVVTNSSNVDTELSLGSGFALSGAGNASGGSLTTIVAVPTTSKVTIFRDVPATQTTSYQEGGAFPAASHERALDKLTMIAQQTKRLADRALKVPETQSNPDDLPNASTGEKLLASSNGTLTWVDNRQLPAYPIAAGAQALVSAGSGQAPTWQNSPSLAFGPITATGSTTPRYLADRFAEVINVEDFGAVGDGVTDDTAALQAAINRAISVGNAIVRFAPNKTYFLNSRAANPVGQVTGNSHLRIVGGTLATKIAFEGNGAKLYSTTYVSSGCDAIYVCSRFHTLAFRNLVFERNVANFNNGGAPTTGVRIWAFDNNEHNLVRFEDCSFIDCNNAIVCNSPTLSTRFRKFRRFECVGCQFLHYKGGNRNGNETGGVTVGCSHWVEHAVFDRCVYDGCVGAVLPSGVGYPKDGFLFPAAKHTYVTNSLFKNSAFEVFKNNVDNESNALYIYFNAFVQPAIGDNVSVTIAGNDGDVLTLNKVYAVITPPRWNIGAVGVYKLIATSNNAYTAGTILTFQRLDKAGYLGRNNNELATGQTVPTGGGNIRVIDVVESDASSHFHNNVFYDVPIKTSTGANPSWAGGRNVWSAPHILIGGGATISGNYFYGGYQQISTDNYSWTGTKPITITGNMFYLYTDVDEQLANSPTSIFSHYGNVIVSGNYFLVQESKDTVYVIFVTNLGTIITNNACVVLKQYNVSSPTRFINFNNGAPAGGWQTVVENNYLEGLDNYANIGGTYQALGPFYGTIRGSVSSPGGDIRIAQRMQSPDGTTYWFKVANGGTTSVSATP